MSKLLEQLRSRRQVSATAGFLKAMHESAHSLRESADSDIKKGLEASFKKFIEANKALTGDIKSVKVLSYATGGYTNEEAAEDPACFCASAELEVVGKNGKTFTFTAQNDGGSMMWGDALTELSDKAKLFEDGMTSGEEKPQITQGEENPVQTAGEETLLKGVCPSCGKSICLCGTGEPLKEACIKEETVTKGEEVLFTSECPCCGKKICVCGTGEPLVESCKLKEDEEPAAQGGQEEKKVTCYCFEVSDQDGQIKDLIEYIGKTAAPGHSFTVVVDPDNADTKKEFFIDGDGSDRIGEVCVEECTEEEMNESCKEALAKKLNESGVDYAVKVKCGDSTSWYLVPGASSEENAKEKFLKKNPNCEVVETETVKWDI